MVAKIADGVLCLGDRHTVTGNEDDALSRIENHSDVFGRRAANVGVDLVRMTRPNPPPSMTPNSTLNNDRFIALHISCVRMTPDAPDQRPGDDQHVVVDHEASRRRRQAGVRVQQGDDDRHIGAADRIDQQHAQDGRQDDQQQVDPTVVPRRHPGRQGGDGQGEHRVHRLLARNENGLRNHCSSCNLAKAIMLPQKVTAPIIPEAAMAIRTDASIRSGAMTHQLGAGHEHGGGAAEAVKQAHHLWHRRHIESSWRNAVPTVVPITKPMAMNQ